MKISRKLQKFDENDWATFAGCDGDDPTITEIQFTTEQALEVLWHIFPNKCDKNYVVDFMENRCVVLITDESGLEMYIGATDFSFYHDCADIVAEIIVEQLTAEQDIEKFAAMLQAIFNK